MAINEIKLCDYDTCTQCYACINRCPQNCISMKEAKDGFFIPYIDKSKCIKCGACMKVCHRLNPLLSYKSPIKTYACWTYRLKDRENSSSGGAFSALAHKIISEGGIVYGATMEENLRVKHIGIEETKDIILLQGSKYLQSYLGNIYEQVSKQLKSGRKVLFTGTPCQIAGLLIFLHHDYDNLYTCDVVCHGVPSQKAFDIYIDKIGIREKCKNFNFRFTKGWGYQLSRQLTVTTKAGDFNIKKIIYPKKSYFLRAFTKGLMFSEACYSCIYARPERVSDITLADYWGLGTMKPFNHSTRKGVSLLLVNNEKSLSLINECLNLFKEERPFEEAVKGNHNLSHTSERPEGRESYYEDSQRMSIAALSAKYGITASARDYLRLIKQSINSFR